MPPHSHREREIDPYLILEIPCSALEDEIQAQFHRKLKSSDNPDELIKAYGMIRDQVGKNRMRWDTLTTCMEDPSEKTKMTVIDLPALIKELAFLTPWELGDDTCLN